MFSFRCFLSCRFLGVGREAEAYGFCFLPLSSLSHFHLFSFVLRFLPVSIEQAQLQQEDFQTKIETLQTKVTLSFPLLFMPSFLMLFLSPSSLFLCTFPFFSDCQCVKVVKCADSK
jgi:hypothetical protein